MSEWAHGVIDIGLTGNYGPAVARRIDAVMLPESCDNPLARQRLDLLGDVWVFQDSPKIGLDPPHPI